jgi:hypothetical protein
MGATAARAPTFTFRSTAKMNALRRALLRKKERRGQSSAVLKQARLLGINLQFENPWHIQKPNEWVFGPNLVQDNIYRCLPQVNLHGMDEGLTAKLNLGILLYAATEVGNFVQAFIMTYVMYSVQLYCTFGSYN